MRIPSSRTTILADALLLLAFLLIVVGFGAYIGLNTLPGDWHARLEKPSFYPPNETFEPVWFSLYVIIGFAGWRIAKVEPDGAAMKMWFAQMILNWLWAPVWFNLHLMWVALAIVSVLLVLIFGFISTAWKPSKLAALLFAPYAAWVAFSMALNLSIAVLN